MGSTPVDLEFSHFHLLWGLLVDLIEQPLWRVIIVNFPTAHKELKASPRKPNVDTESKSVKSANFEVWCLAAEKGEKIRNTISCIISF